MISKIKNLLESCRIKDIITLSSGVFIAQVIVYLLQPILTRLYSPETFGIASLFTSVIAIFTPFMTLQYEQYIAIVKKDDECRKLILSVTCLVFIIAFILLIGFFIYTNFIDNKMFKELGVWIYLVIPTLIVIGLSNILIFLNNRFGEFKTLANFSIYKAVSQGFLKVGFSTLRRDFRSLLVAVFIGNIVGLKILLKNLKNYFVKFPEFTRKDFVEVIFKYKKQMLLITPGNICAAMAYAILPIMIKDLYGITEAGYFSLTVSMLAIPITLIANSVDKIFIKSTSDNFREEGTYFKIYRNFSAVLIIISLFVLVTVDLLAVPVFKIVFGDLWVRSAIFLKILMPMNTVRIISTALDQGLTISELQGIKFIIQFLTVILLATAFFVTKGVGLPINYFLQIVNIIFIFSYGVLWFIGLVCSYNKAIYCQKNGSK